MRSLAHALSLATVFATGLVACEGCRPSQTGKPDPVDAPPTVRIYVMSDLAGALEPCGCVKDQLGGLNHAAAWIANERAKAPNALAVEAGPLLFMDPVLKSERAAQEKAKAETLARSLVSVGLTAFAPGRNDWAAGQVELGRLAGIAKASPLGANLAAPGAVPWTSSVTRDVGGVKLGFVGVSAPDRAEAGVVESVTVASATDAVRAETAKLKGQGAQLVIALAAVGRGEAKRIADLVPDLFAIVVGAPGGTGEANTETPPPERVGNVLVLETGNHLQTLGVLDLYVRDGSFELADATGLELAEKRAALARQADELRAKIADWDSNPNIDKKDVAAQRAKLDKIEADRAALDARPAPAKGSFFRYRSVEVRDALGKDEAVTRALDDYYKQVNEQNRAAFASKLPAPAPPGGNAYVGVEACTSTCHVAPRAVWNKTRHAKAYETLAVQNKQFNLDCASCHVTGYDEPGGSTLAHVEKLESVQCEVCHGPGSQHAKDPKKPIPIPSPGNDRCLGCHHPPHVLEFDPAKKRDEILGPGHGMPLPDGGK